MSAQPLALIVLLVCLTVGWMNHSYNFPWTTFLTLWIAAVLGGFFIALALLLDQPARGIDVAAKVDVYELVNRLTAEGKAVVLVSSELPELLGMSDRILVLHQGQLTGAFDRAEASPEKILATAMGRSPISSSPSAG